MDEHYSFVEYFVENVKPSFQYKSIIKKESW